MPKVTGQNPPGQNPPGQNPPGQNPPDKIPPDEIPPVTIPPSQNPPKPKSPQAIKSPINSIQKASSLPCPIAPIQGPSSRGDFDRGDFVQGDFGWGDFVQGDFVLEPMPNTGHSSWYSEVLCWPACPRHAPVPIDWDDRFDQYTIGGYYFSPLTWKGQLLFSTLFFLVLL